MSASIHFFQQPCPEGWIYPCSLKDITRCLSRLPEQDLEGLWAVGLMPSTRKDKNANGRYFFGTQPVIHLYSYPDDLRFKLGAYTKFSDIERSLAVEISYGMMVECQGSRFFCSWSAENLRRFMVGHVLLHEVGHHVFFQQRNQQGIAYRPNTRAAEQFAEDYALRIRRLMGEAAWNR